MTRRQILAGAAAAPLLAQDPGSVIRVDVELVNVTFSVRDKRGALVPTLLKDDFEVWEDGKKQDIRSFTKEGDLPLTIGLLVDVSPSQERLIETERRAAAAFFRTVLKNKDMAFVISFGGEAELLQDLTSSPKLLTQSLDGLRVNASVQSPIGQGPIATTPRGTIMFDAVYLAADEKLKGEVDRKVVLLITDGVDMGSRKKIGQAIESAHRSDAIIYGIYYFDRAAYGYHMYGVSDGDLRKMSEDTGGRVFRVERRTTLEDVFKQLEDEMRNQYTLSYSSTNPSRDGGFRKLEIRAKNKELKVQARRGYFASRS
ncbi:MAG: VWA domain-containing protein [Bryobacteraceae bacterium]|nr:VWA domain-containing protein [Bryobacteraceae bacterium]